mgnify:CR=1 FL=1
MFYTLKKVANGKNGLFYNDTFCGIYSEYFGFYQFSGNKEQLFDLNIVVNYLLQTNEVVYSSKSIVGNQFYLRVTTKPHVISEGVLTKHLGVFSNVADLKNYCTDNDIVDYAINSVNDNYFASKKLFNL